MSSGVCLFEFLEAFWKRVWLLKGYSVRTPHFHLTNVHHRTGFINVDHSPYAIHMYDIILIVYPCILVGESFDDIFIKENGNISHPRNNWNQTGKSSRSIKTNFNFIIISQIFYDRIFNNEIDSFNDFIGIGATINGDMKQGVLIKFWSLQYRCSL